MSAVFDGPSGTRDTNPILAEGQMFHMNTWPRVQVPEPVVVDFVRLEEMMRAKYRIVDVEPGSSEPVELQETRAKRIRVKSSLS